MGRQSHRPAGVRRDDTFVGNRKRLGSRGPFANTQPSAIVLGRPEQELLPDTKPIEDRAEDVVCGALSHDFIESVTSGGKIRQDEFLVQRIAR